jgi:hypothetical protein
MNLFGRAEDFSRFATHDDLQRLEERLSNRIDQSEQHLRTEIQTEVRRSESSTTRWMIGIGAVIVGVLVALYGPLVAVIFQLLSHLPPNPVPVS